MYKFGITVQLSHAAFKNYIKNNMLGSILENMFYMAVQKKFEESNMAYSNDYGYGLQVLNQRANTTKDKAKILSFHRDYITDQKLPFAEKVDY